MAPPREKAGFAAASVPEEGILKRELVWAGCAPAPPAAGAAVFPKRGFDAVVAGAAGVVDSAGLLPALPNKPPPAGAAGVDPNKGFCCVFVPDPKRPPVVDCGCDAPPNGEEEAAAGAAVEGVVEELVPAFRFPNRPPPVFAAPCPNKD